MWRHFSGRRNSRARLCGEGESKLVSWTGNDFCILIKAILSARSRIFHKLLYQQASPQRKNQPNPPPVRENKLRLFLKRSSEPLLNLQNESQKVWESGKASNFRNAEENVTKISISRLENLCWLFFERKRFRFRLMSHDGIVLRRGPGGAHEHIIKHFPASRVLCKSFYS